jgi:serine/threonine-protein kinase HipA
MVQQPIMFDPRSVRTADVYKAGKLVAQLRRANQGIQFHYLPNAVAVATTLQVSDVPVTYLAGAIPPFFAGLLPEGRRLTALRNQVKTSSDDELSLLLVVGNDVVGDVQVVPEGEAPSESEALVTVKSSFAEVRFSEVLRGADIVDRSGIPGVQDKASARMISVPVARASRRYILKVDPPEFPLVVQNEFYFIQLAKSAGIPTVDAEIVTDAVGQLGLLVRRFDRTTGNDGSVVLLACEDACQLLNLWPADKYNVTSEVVTRAIIEVCPAAPVAARDVFRQFCFAWLTGNGDVHAKNISVLATPQGEWRVSPAYDLPSTLPYRDLTMALELNGKRDGLSRCQMLEFAQTIGLAPRAATRIIADLIDATDRMITDLKDGAVPFSQYEIHEWTRRLAARRKVLML